MNLICVDPKDVHQVWPLVCARLYEAIKRGGITPFKQVADNVGAGRSLLWLVTHGNICAAAVITELHETEFNKACVIVACGGEGMHLWLPLIGGLENYARAEGCTVMRIIGRRGWERVLDDYELTNVILEKDLGNGQKQQSVTKH